LQHPTDHILIAADDDTVRAVVARVVVRTYPSVTITAVRDGAEALLVYRQRGANLLITNNDMAILGGVDLVRALRAQQVTLPILMISADTKVAPAALAAGATRFMVKPFKVADLQRALTRLLPP